MKYCDVCDGYPTTEAMEGGVRKEKEMQMTAMLSSQLL